MQKKYIRLVILTAAFAGLVFAFGCSSSTWDDARQTNTYKSYQTYITDNPRGEHVREAKNRADSLYWERLSSSHKCNRSCTVF